MINKCLRVCVAKKEWITSDIVLFELVDVNGENLPPFTAGAHIDVHIPDGLTRQYSLCNNPSETHRYEIGVLRDHQSRGGSIAMHDNVMVGDLIDISEPRNAFSLQTNAEESVLLAGGIGITPLLCMAERLSDLGSHFQLHYCNRSCDRSAFKQRIEASSFADNVLFYYDDAPDEQKLDIEKVLARPSAYKHLYICGPTGFLTFVREKAKEIGWADQNIHFEYFGGNMLESENTNHFQIQIASSGKLYNVSPEETIVDVLLANSIKVPISCEQGVCGTCLTRVLDGIPEHLDLYLSEEERVLNNQMLLCCSRSLSRLLVLDL